MDFASKEVTSTFASTLHYNVSLMKIFQQFHHESSMFLHLHCLAFKNSSRILHVPSPTLPCIQKLNTKDTQQIIHGFCIKRTYLNLCLYSPLQCLSHENVSVVSSRILHIPSPTLPCIKKLNTKDYIANHTSRQFHHESSTFLHLHCLALKN